MFYQIVKTSLFFFALGGLCSPEVARANCTDALSISKVVIKRAGLQDIAETHRLHKILKEALHIKDMEFVWSERSFVEEAIREKRLFVAKVDDRIAGAISFIAHREALEIETLVVGSNFRGYGIGSRLLDFASEEGRRLGYTELLLNSYVRYKKKTYYENRGFMCNRKMTGFHGKFYVFTKKIK